MPTIKRWYCHECGANWPDGDERPCQCDEDLLVLVTTTVYLNGHPDPLSDEERQAELERCDGCRTL